jgi:hypothetical protein
MSRKEYCYMYLIWTITICVLIWYVHMLLTLPENVLEFDLGREKGDL